MTTLPEEAVKAAAKSITVMRKIGEDLIQHPDFIFIEQDDCPYFYEESELAEVGSPVTEYIRADLYAALEAQPAEARKALEQAEQQLDYGQVDAAHRILIRALSSPNHAYAGKVEGDGWRPIESAPKDGTIVLLGWNDPDIEEIGAVAGWYESGPADKCWYDQYHEPVTATHWMPLRPFPAAPASEGAE